MTENLISKKLGKKQKYQSLLDKCNQLSHHSLQSQSNFAKPVLSASAKRGRYIKVASAIHSEDPPFIPVGTTIIRETPSAFTILKDYLDSLCIACLSPLPLQQQQKNDNILDDSTVPDFFCPTPSKRGIVCKGCIKQTFYCSTACQIRDTPRHGLECKVLRDLPGITASHGADYSLFRLVLAVIVRKYLEDEADSACEGESLGLFDPTPYECVQDMISNRKYCSEEWLDAITECGNYMFSSLKSVFVNMML